MESVEITSKLISCQSITPIDDGAIKFLKKILDKTGFKCYVLEFGHNHKKVINLYASFKGGVGPNICFAGHTDVVPPGDLKQWKSKPFIPTIKKGVLYGRGTSDMKGAIGAFLDAAIKYIKQQKKNFKGSISFLITGDEEGEAKNGTKKVVDWLIKKGEKIDYCLVGEPTNPNQLGEMAKIGRRGSLNGVLTITGQQGHVAYPDRALNPVRSLIKFCEKLLEPLDSGNKIFQASNAEITSIDIGNTVTNLIPSRAKVRFNVRFNNNFTSKSLIRLLKKKLNTIGKNYSIEFTVSGESFYNPSKVLSSNLTSAINSVLDIEPEMSTSGGTSDARFISKICPVIEFGLVGKTMHQVNENVKEKDIKNLSKIYLEFIKNSFD